ncbi:MAG: DUF1707 SHOCT-like domain-containing protein [Gemmatimonadaceae bacterium]
MSIELDRERTVQALCSHFAQDRLTTQELELRFDEVYKANSADELRGVMRGLPALAAPLVPAEPLPMYSVAPALPGQDEKRLLALMSDVRRQGAWVVPRRIRAAAWMGAIRIDLREAQIPEGGVDIETSAIMGEVRIILPPGLHADVDGFAVMGEFSDRSRATAGVPGMPVIRVTGKAIMGAVRVETRMPRESTLEAWKRRLRGW